MMIKYTITFPLQYASNIRKIHHFTMLKFHHLVI